MPGKELASKSVVKDRPHTVVMQDREKLTVTGINDVENFNEETIGVATEAGYMVIKGENLHINRLNLDDGELMVEGNINVISYVDKIGGRDKGSGFLGKMFK